jgi:hypothetical protein
MKFENRLSELLERGQVWSTAIYVQRRPLSLGGPVGTPWKVFNAKRLDIFGRHPHTYADPFLFVHSGALYLFLEIVRKGGIGEIAAFRTSDLQQFDNLGVVLTMPFHLSFPFVFENQATVYMVPESSQASSISLYQFDNFPFGLRKVRTILNGQFCDSHLLKYNDLWFLFTTYNDELHLYTADDILFDDFRSHPCSPISLDKRLSRSAGSVLNIGGSLYRVAQDCSITYGENVSLLEIEVLSAKEYKERVVKRRLFALENSWDALGAHHFSACEFGGKTVIATDGKQKDLFINKISSLWRN